MGKLKIKDGSPYVIIRGKDSGAFSGFLIKKEGTECTLDNTRRLWHWEGAASLSQLAIEGVKSPKKCKFTIETMGHTILDCIEIIPCTQNAYINIKNVDLWKQ